jgi:chemotaxis protein histidine kinase CheA
VVKARRALRKQAAEKRQAEHDAAQREAARIKQEKNAKLLALAGELIMARVKSAGGDLNWLGLMAQWPESVPKVFAQRAVEQLTTSGELVENIQANERVLIIPQPLSVAAG